MTGPCHLSRATRVERASSGFECSGICDHETRRRVFMKPTVGGGALVLAGDCHTALMHDECPPFRLDKGGSGPEGRALSARCSRLRPEVGPQQSNELVARSATRASFGGANHPIRDEVFSRRPPFRPWSGDRENSRLGPQRQQVVDEERWPNDGLHEGQKHQPEGPRVRVDVVDERADKSEEPDTAGATRSTCLSLVGHDQIDVTRWPDEARAAGHSCLDDRSGHAVRSRGEPPT